MAIQFQTRRGTTAENNAFTGAAGEVTVDTTNNRVRVHDGATLGGFPIGDFVNVLDFGAIGDGIADDTLAIQSALNASSLVYIPAGVYKITDTLKYNSNQFIIGEGNATIIQLGAGLVKNMFIPNGTLTTGFFVENVTFKNITIDHNITDVADFVESVMSIIAFSAVNMLIENVQFLNPSGDSIYINKKYGGNIGSIHPNNIKILNCSFIGDRLNRNGISVIDGKNITISNNYFYRMTKEGMPCAIDLEPNNTSELIENVSITNNIIHDCRAGISTYITATSPTDYNSIKNIVISNNTIKDTENGISIFNASSVVVTNNTFENVVSGGTISKASCVNYSNNTMKNIQYSGINILDIFDCKIDNNIIEIVNDTYSSNSCFGVKVSTGGFVLATNYAITRGSIGNNTINSTVSSPANSTGIGLEGNVNNIKISGKVSGFKKGIYIGKKSDAVPVKIEYDLDVADNITPFLWFITGFTPSSINEFKLGENITYGTSSFGGSSSKTITGLPVTTSSQVVAYRVGSTDISNGISARATALGQIVVYSSAADNGNFIWEIKKL